MVNQKINKLTSLILVILIFSVLCFPAPKTKVLVPKNANTPILINISGKSLTYYPILFDDASVFSVRGPGKLKIITRRHLDSQNENKSGYILFYRINGGKKIEVDFNNVKPDGKAYFENFSSGYPSIGENINIELTRGENTIEISNSSNKAKVYVRVLYTKIKEKKIDWISLSPVYPNYPVSLVTNEDVVTYYRYSSDKPLKIQVAGPTTLRILNRIEFDFKMKGKVNYRIEVREDKKLKNTYMLCSDRSDVTSYKKDVKKTPGRANEIVIAVPSGTHTYEIVSLDKYTTLAKILFPKKDIKLERF